KIYAALTWDRGFELLHRAQRHTNPIDPRPRLDASAYLGRARRYADQLSWNWIRTVHALRWCRGDSSWRGSGQRSTATTYAEADLVGWQTKCLKPSDSGSLSAASSGRSRTA